MGYEAKKTEHAGAKHVWLSIKKTGDRIVVELRDDGRGFDYNGLMSNPAAKRGLGLTGLVERAHTLNGDLEVDSMPGRGTRVIMTVPCNGKTFV